MHTTNHSHHMYLGDPLTALPVKFKLILLPNTDILSESFKRGGLPPIEYPFKPHLTLATIPRSKREAHSIPAHTYSALVREEFGEQKVEALQFLPLDPRITLEKSYCITDG